MADSASPVKPSSGTIGQPYRQTAQCRQYSSLPRPVIAPALDFNVDAFISSYKHSNSLEKALVHRSASSISLQSNTSTLVANSHPAFASLKYQQEHSYLPRKRYPRIIRHLRFTILTVYRRLFTTIFLVNLIPLILLFCNHSVQAIDLNTLATAASTNFLVAILIRQDFIVNAIFRTAWLVPWSVPLRFRRWAARCYCYGGIHSGAAVAGTVWWLMFSALLATRFLEQRLYTLPIVITTCLILLLLIAILILACPSLRSRYHNTFELTHRFLGWTSILLFWVQLLLLTAHLSSTSTSSNATFEALLIRSPTFWNLILITTLIIYPWLRLRKWTFDAEVLSSHAVRLNFTQRVHKFSCLSISTSPLTEWHPFATFPSASTSDDSNLNPPRSNSLIISAAGDWTRNIIAQAHSLSKQQTTTRRAQSPPSNANANASPPNPPPQMHFWTKSTPKAGVLSLSTLFPRVILLTTGSGIGPCLSSLLDRPVSQHARLIWSTRSPLATYGANLLAQVYRADPNAVVIDTDAAGRRPDLVAVAWRVAREVRAEAVFVLSNRGVTGRVVGGLESRGVAAYGPIWDS